jgi:hypothetical protein
MHEVFTVENSFVSFCPFFLMYMLHVKGKSCGFVMQFNMVIYYHGITFNSSSSEGGVLCVVGCSWQNSYLGQLEEEKYGVGQ